MNKLSNYLVFGENGRSIATFYTLSLEIMREYKNRGWSYEIDYKGNGFWLRAPDEWLVDLTDSYKIYYYGNPIINLAYYNYLKSFSDKNRLKEYIDFVISNNKIFYKDFEFVIADGIVLQSEIRIIGSDKRIKNLKHDLINSFIESSLYLKYYNEAKNYLGKIRNIKFEKNKLSAGMSEFYENLNGFLKVVNESASNKNNKIVDLAKQLPDTDIIILIPTGCFKYMSSIITEDNLDKIMFWEMHVNSHVNKCFTLFNKDLKGKKVLIIDQIYSGKTLEIIKNLVIKQGGEPLTIGMFPKSLYSLKSTDMVVILDKLFKTNEIVNDDNWVSRMYKNILCKGEKNERIY